MFKAVGQRAFKLLLALMVSLTALVGVVATAPAAHAVQSFNNALVADAGIAEIGSSRPTGWNQPGECIKSVQRWVANAGGHFGGGGVISGYVNSGAQEVSLATAVKGDVIQYTAGNGNDDDWSHVHTVVVIDNLGNGRFNIVQSNSPPGSGLVTRVNNWLPMPASGWVSRVWRLGAANVSATPPPQTNRIGVLNNGSLIMKEGPINATWTVVGGGQSFKLSPNRVAVYGTNPQGNYELVVKDGSLGATWVTVTGAVDDYQVTDSRVGMLVGGQLFIKEGSLGAVWQLVATGVQSFKLSPNRIAVYSPGQLSVKEGPLNAAWVAVTGWVDEYEVTDNRVGIRVGVQVSVKEGSLGALWVHVTDGSAFELSPNRIAVYNGSLIVKEGPVNAPWATVIGAVDDFRVTDGRVGVLIGGQLHVKDGPLNALWTHVGDGSSFALT